MIRGVKLWIVIICVFAIWNSFSEFILDGIFLYIFGICLLIIFFVFFSLGGSYPFYLLYFGAKIFHLHAHLAFGFWLLILALVSLDFWLLALAVGFTWLLAVVGFWFLVRVVVVPFTHFCEMCVCV